MPRKKPKEGPPEVHKDLEGFNIEIDPLGNIQANMPIEELQKFLEDKVEDRKLKEKEEKEKNPETDKEEKEKSEDEQADKGSDS